MNGRRQGYIKTAKCLFLRKKKVRREGLKMIVVTWSRFHSPLSKSQCYKLNPALSIPARGTTYCSLTRSIIPLSRLGIRSQQAFNQLWLFWAEKLGSPWPPSHDQSPTLPVRSKAQAISGPLGTRWRRRKEGRGCLTWKQNQARTDVCIRVHIYPIVEKTGWRASRNQ